MPRARGRRLAARRLPPGKGVFARQLKELLALVNRPAPGLIPPVDLRRRGRENPRLAHVAPALAEELQARARAVDLAGPVLGPTGT